MDNLNIESNFSLDSIPEGEFFQFALKKANWSDAKFVSVCDYFGIMPVEENIFFVEANKEDISLIAETGYFNTIEKTSSFDNLPECEKFHFFMKKDESWSDAFFNDFCEKNDISVIKDKVLYHVQADKNDIQFINDSGYFKWIQKTTTMIERPRQKYFR